MHAVLEHLTAQGAIDVDRVGLPEQPVLILLRQSGQHCLRDELRERRGDGRVKGVVRA